MFSKYNIKAEFNENIIKENGNSRYAFVTIVVEANIYATPAIIFAESIRKTGSLCDLVVLVDDKINTNTIDLLKQFYDKIIRITNKIILNNTDIVQQIILNKFECFKLIEYDKIILVDVDTILFVNIDDYFLKYDNISGLYVEDKLNCGFLFIKPSTKIYYDIKKMIETNFDEISKEKKPFEYLVKKIFEPELLEIDIGINKYENTDGIQYSIDKPFLMSSDKSINVRVQLKHFKIWFIYLTNLINNFSNFKNYECLKESLEISKYFLHDLSRYRIKYINAIKKNLFDVTKDYYGIIDNKYVNYYYLDISKEYNSKYPLYSIESSIESIINYSIKNYDKFNPQNLSNLIFDSKKNTKELINEFSKLPNKNLFDNILKNILKIHKNSFAVLYINKKVRTREFEKDLIYEKEIKMNGQSLQNLIFNVYQNYTYRKRLTMLLKYNENYDYIINLQIYVTKFQIKLLNYTNKKNFYFIIEPESRIKLSSIISNQNTLEKINNGKLQWIYNGKISKNAIYSMMYFQTLKKWIYNNYTGEQIDNIVIKQEQDKLILIDSNSNLDSNIETKIRFMRVINDSNINIDNYWELEGIKFLD